MWCLCKAHTTQHAGITHAERWRPTVQTPPQAPARGVHASHCCYMSMTAASTLLTVAARA